jgi:hypothetical protein
VFMFSNTGVPTIATGPAWSSSTAGAATRGTGASTTQLARIGGQLVNAVQITGRNGSTTYTIAANLATYLGTIYIDTVAGQITCHRSWGQNRKWGIWNLYNQQPLQLLVGDSTASWAYNVSTWRASNQAASGYMVTWSSVGFNYPATSNEIVNGCSITMGLITEDLDAKFAQAVTITATSSSNQTAQVGVGLNSITAPSGQFAQYSLTNGASVTTTNVSPAELVTAPTIGLTTLACLERTTVNSGGSTFNGTSSFMQMEVAWNG